MPKNITFPKIIMMCFVGCVVGSVVAPSFSVIPWLTGPRDIYPDEYFSDGGNIRIYNTQRAWSKTEQQADLNLLKQSIDSLVTPTKNCINKTKLDAINKNQIPYSVNESEIYDAICQLPTRTDKTYYWTDIKKNNDTGSIQVTIYGRAYMFDRQIADSKHYTLAYEKHTISGFQQANTENLVKERSVGIYLTQKDYRSYHQDRFHFTGSGVVFRKDPNLPKYYILTAKHLFTNPVHKHNSSVYSHIDFANSPYYYGSKNLKNHLTLGTSMPNPQILNNYVNDNDPVVQKTYRGTFLTNQNIKKILLVKDFSRRYKDDFHITQRSNSRHENTVFKNLNHNYDELTTTRNNKKITLDAVCLSVEFVNKSVDPFQSWWQNRPSKYRLLEEKDFTGQNTLIIKSQNPYTKTGENIIDHAYLGGYQWRRIKGEFADIKVAKGALNVSRYDFNNQNYNKHNHYGKSAFMKYLTKEDQLIGGSSGGGVFDKNLNIIGINWGGASDWGQNVNVFSWLGLNPNLKNIYDPKHLVNLGGVLKNFQSQGKVYDYTKF